MIGIYFSGTGNSKYCLERFLAGYEGKGKEIKAISIEDKELSEQVRNQEELVFAYPVQFSNLPKMLRDFVVEHQELWSGKKVFVIATMGLFSGDGAGMLARLLKKYGAEIVGGLHVKMPDSICDEKALKYSEEKNRSIVTKAEKKIEESVHKMKSGNPTQEGLGIFYHLAGLFGQRLYFMNKTKAYTDKLKIDPEKCIGCGKCERLCPMKNIVVKDKTAVSGNQCTMCYRCVNHCPKQAITLLGKEVVSQWSVEKSRNG